MHRNPGVVGAALSDEKVSTELIADTFHVNKGMFKLVSKIKGDKLCLITDCMRAGGMPDGDYELGGQPIEMKNGKATLKNSDTLAGSSTNLLQELKNLVAFGLPLETALTAMTAAPAKAVRLDNVGSIAVGKCADLLLLDENLNLTATYIDGQQI